MIFSKSVYCIFCCLSYHLLFLEWVINSRSRRRTKRPCKHWVNFCGCFGAVERNYISISMCDGYTKKRLYCQLNALGCLYNGHYDLLFYSIFSLFNSYFVLFIWLQNFILAIWTYKSLLFAFISVISKIMFLLFTSVMS